LDALSRLELIRVSDRILGDAGAILPAEVRSLDAIHLATMQHLGASLARVLTYDDRMAAAAAAMGLSVLAPS
jgi:predicted nucleic acid-binding protein